MTTSIEWTHKQVGQMLKTYPHITAMEAARRSGWTVWEIQDRFDRK